MMHHKMNRALSSVGMGILCGMVTACAGGDTPARNGELVNAVARFHGNGQTGSVGGSGSGGNSGSGGSSSGNGGSSSGNGGSSSGDGGSASGDGGSASGDGGSSGSEAGMGGDGGGEPTGCDGFAVLTSNCSGGTCHGTGSSFTDFAADEATAAQWADEKAQAGCNSNSALVFDTEDPSQSLVILKLGSSPPCGSPMPFGTQGGVISDEDIACIEEFIGGL